MNKSHIVHTGDIILLQVRKADDRENCYICCDGVVNSNLTVVATEDVNLIPDVRDCLFQIVYKLSYHAHRDLKQRLKESKEASELSLLPFRKHLEKEESQNKEILSMRQPIFYGESIQLLHVKTGKFVSVLPKESAPTEKQARAIAVCEGSIQSAFRLQPFYKYRLHGEPVLYEEQCIMDSWKLGGNWHLHTVTGRTLMPLVGQNPGLRYHEVNCSTDVNGFYPVKYSRDMGLLNFSSTCRLFHAQTEAYLGASCGASIEKRPYLKPEEEPAKTGGDHKSTKSLWSKGMWVLEPVKPNRLRPGALQWGEHFCLKHLGSGMYLSVERNAVRRKNSDLATGSISMSQLKSVDESQAVPSESATALSKGARAKSVRISDADEHHYGDSRTSVDSYNAPVVHNVSTVSSTDVLLSHGEQSMAMSSMCLKRHGLHLSCLKKTVDDSCLFSLDPIEYHDSKVVTMQDNKVKALIMHEDSYGKLWMAGSGSRTKSRHPGSKFKSVQIHPSLVFFFIENRRQEEVMKLENLSMSQPEYVQMVNLVAGRKHYLEIACEQVKKTPKSIAGALGQMEAEEAVHAAGTNSGAVTGSASSAVTDRADHRHRTMPKDTRPSQMMSAMDGLVRAEKQQQKVKGLFTKIKQVLSESIFFLTGEDTKKNALKCSMKSIPERQRIVKDLKYLDMTVHLKDVLWESGYKVDALTSRTLVDLGLDGQMFPDKPILDELEMKVICLIVVHWRACFQDNRIVEDYFDKNGWVPMLNELNGRGLGAPKALSQLVANNIRLLQKMDQQVIQRFSDFIQALGPDEMWPNFMKGVCSCQGQPITSKQQLVLRMMYNPGPYASEEDKKKWGPNKDRQFMGVKLGAVVAAFPPRAPRNQMMMGVELLASGIHEILVSWSSQEEAWNIGQDWLYFHPKHLGMQTKEYGRYISGFPQNWVSVAEIVWVLDPERTYHLVHQCEPTEWPKKSKEVTETAQYQALTVLAKYFIAQLNLLAEMCLDRQINSIKSIEKEYHFNLIVCAMYQNSLAPQLRRAFCNLCITLWLDRHPHYKIQLPNVIFPMNRDDVMSGALPGLPQFELMDSGSEGDSENLFYTIKDPCKFDLLLYYGDYHLQALRGRMVASDMGRNAYTTSVMQMMLKLSNFGFFHSVQMMQESAKSLMRVMDGRTDWLDAPDVKLESTGDEPPDDGGDGGDNGAEETSARAPLLGASSRIMKVCCVQKNLTNWDPLGVETDHRVDSIRGPLYLQIQDTADGPLRYADNESNNIVMESKVMMLRLAIKISEFALNSCVARIVQIFRREHALGCVGGYIEDSVIDDVIRDIRDDRFDFNLLSGAHFNTMLCDLLLYTKPKIFSTSLKLLNLWNHRVGRALSSLRNVRILCATEEVEQYHKIKVDCARLANLVQTHEFWGTTNVFGPLHMGMVEECKALLIRLRQICSIGGVGNDHERPDPRMQDTLANFSLGKELSKAFDMPFSQLTGQAKEVAGDVMRLTTQLLVQYVNSHPQNQEEQFKYLEKINPWFVEGIGVANVVAAIFSGNRRLCENMPADLLFTFAKVLQRNREAGGKGFLPHQLAFIQSVVVVGQRPIAKNKAIVVDILKNPQFDKVLHLMDGPDDKEHRNILLEEFRSWSELQKPQMFRKWSGGDAEIQYHNRSVELLAVLCLGRDRSGSTAFVQSKMPPLDLATEYLEVDVVQQKVGHVSPDIVAMCRVLKSNLLMLLEYAYYNSELQDGIFVASVLHARLLESLHASILRLEPQLTTGKMEKLDAQFLIRILKTLVAYCEHGNRKTESPEVTAIIEDDFRPTLQRLHKGKSRLPAQDDVYRSAVARALGWITNDISLKSKRVMEAMRGTSAAEMQTVAFNSALQEFVTTLVQDKRVIQAQKDDHQEMVTRIRDIAKWTNVTDHDYQQELKEAEKECRELPPQVDFRRNQLNLDDIVYRIVTHCLVPEHLRDWVTTEFALNILNNVLEEARENIAELARLQNKFAVGGAVQLVVQTLMAKPDSKVFQEAISLGSRMLEPNNKNVQDAFEEYFRRIDESGLWQVFVEIYDQIISNIKYVRMLKEQKDLASTEVHNADVDGEWEEDHFEHDSKDAGVLTHEEEDTVHIFSNDLITAISVMRFCQTLCEGHKLHMQIYIYQQGDNGYSYDFVEKTVELFMKFCKNERTSDQVTVEEANCCMMALDLLLEVTTGPCARNQEFLSVSGLVESAQKVSQGRFLKLRQLEEDAYPSVVRKLKARLMLLINALLETRTDLLVHRNVLFRTDAYMQKRRLMFVHRWFLGKESDSPASQTTNKSEWNCEIDHPENEDSIVVPDDPPEILLADLEEDQLDDYFLEAFQIVMVQKQIAAISDEFREASAATVAPFEDEPSLFVNIDTYNQAKQNNMMEIKYAASFNFFDRWVNSIEIVLGGRIYDYYFRYPTVCDFVLGRTKEEIVNKCCIVSPEDKAQDFTEMVRATYDETTHTRMLSRWGLHIRKTRLRPFNFFLKNDSQNLQNISKYGLALAMLINGVLFFALIVPQADIEEDVYGAVPIMQIDYEHWVDALGALYSAMMASALIVVLVTYFPLDFRKTSAACANDPPLYTATALRMCAVAFAATGALAAGLGLFNCWILGLVTLLHVCSGWHEVKADTANRTSDDSKETVSCPNNFVAKVAVTTSLTLRKQPTSRRVFLVVASIHANVGMYYWYSFLLLDLLFLSPMLQNVIKAVTVPLDSLCLTAIIGIVVMYEYAIIAFYFFRKDYKGTCNTMLDCTTSTIYHGLRADIGTSLREVGVYDEGNWYSRIGFDLSYFVVITTILMNVIFGIIIDTFGSLRDETQEREVYMKNTTFISCIDRGEIDKVAAANAILNGFEYLEKQKQNRWSYLNFIFYLRRKNPVEFAGPETRIFTLLKDRDVSWMPLQNCRLFEMERMMGMDTDSEGGLAPTGAMDIGGEARFQRDAVLSMGAMQATQAPSASSLGGGRRNSITSTDDIIAGARHCQEMVVHLQSSLEQIVQESQRVAHPSKSRTSQPASFGPAFSVKVTH